MTSMVTRSGMVTLIGRPNVGKSSLLNALIGRKASIVSHKPQTTRHAIQGVLHGASAQVVFVDTPGLHQGGKRALNRVMNDTAASALHDVDLVLWVVESQRFTDEDQAVLQKLAGLKAPVALVVNKVDRVDDKTRLLPEIESLSALRDFAFIMPVSATRGISVERLGEEILARMPEGPPLYPPDMTVGYDNAFLVCELVREKLTRTLNQELPYSLTVSVESYAVEPLHRGGGEMHRISAVIWVEREGQKGIVVGEDGSSLKRVGTAARRELETQLGAKVFLQLWCRVRENWSDDAAALKQFGLGAE